MEPVIIAQVKEHLAQGDFDNALELLNTYAESNLDGKMAAKVRNEIIYLQGQIAEVKKAESRGLIAFEQAERNRNQIRLSMIGLTDAVAGKDGDHPVFSDDKPQSTGAQSGGGSNNIYKTIVIGIAAIVLFVIGISMCEDEPEQAADFQPTEEISSSAPDFEADHGGDVLCSLETLDVLDVLLEADINADVIGSLSANSTFDVLQIKFQTTADGEAEFFQVRTEKGLGWVEYENDLMRLGPGCN